MLIAEDDGKPVGWAFAHDETWPSCSWSSRNATTASWPSCMWCREARGKGLGRALIEGCEAWARGRGHKLLTVGVLASNARAIRSYEGAGYAPYGITMRRYL